MKFCQPAKFRTRNIGMPIKRLSSSKIYLSLFHSCRFTFDVNSSARLENKRQLTLSPRKEFFLQSLHSFRAKFKLSSDPDSPETLRQPQTRALQIQRKKDSSRIHPYPNKPIRFSSKLLRVDSRRFPCRILFPRKRNVGRSTLEASSGIRQMTLVPGTVNIPRIRGWMLVGPVPSPRRARWLARFPSPRCQCEQHADQSGHGFIFSRSSHWLEPVGFLSSGRRKAAPSGERGSPLRIWG